LEPCNRSTVEYYSLFWILEHTIKEGCSRQSSVDYPRRHTIAKTTQTSAQCDTSTDKRALGKINATARKSFWGNIGGFTEDAGAWKKEQRAYELMVMGLDKLIFH